MKNKSIGLVFLWWAEIVFSARVLLFTIPVLITKARSGVLNYQGVEDAFVLMLTFAAVLYCLVGIASVIGHRLWLVFHLLTGIWVMILAGWLLKYAQDAQRAVEPYHWIPALASAASIALSFLLKPKTVQGSV